MNKWEEFYRLAAIEVDGKKMPDRIAAARTAVRDRLQDLEHSSNHHAEKRRLNGTLRILNVLETEAQDW